MEEYKKNWKKWIYWFTFGVAIISVYKLLDNFSQIGSFVEDFLKIIMPFIIGLLISYILYIPCKKIESIYDKVKFIRKKSRLLSIITVYLIVILLIAIIIRFLVPIISQSFTDLKNNFQSYFNMAMQRINELPDDSVLKSESIMKFTNDIQNIDLKKYINIDTLSHYAQGAINFASSIFNFFIAIIVSIYILRERRDILNFAKKMTAAVCKKNAYNNISYYFRKTNEVFFKFLASQLLDAIVVGILTSIAMSI